MMHLVRSHLVNLLHGALASRLSGGRSFLRSLFLGSLSLLIDVQAERHKLVDALSEGGWLIDGEAGDQQRSLVEELGNRLDGAVILSVGLNLLLQLTDYGRLGRDFEGLLRGHVGGHGSVTESLSLHDTFHVGGPAELASADGARRSDQLVGDNDLLHLIAEDVLESLCEALELFLLFLTLLLLLLGLFALEILGNINQLLAIKLLELSHGILVNGVNQEQDFEVLLLEGVQEGRLLDGLDGFTSDVVDLLLVGPSG